MVNVTNTPSGDIITYYDVDGVPTELIYNAGSMAWIIVATALVFIMIPGLGFFYAGLLRKKSALSMIWMSMTVMSVVTFEWFFWGFSLAFSTTSSNKFIGVSVYVRSFTEHRANLLTALRSSLFLTCRTWTTLA